VRIEVLWWEGCPSLPDTLALVDDTLTGLGRPPHQLDVREIHDEDEAARAGFIGSPTVRVEGADIEPAPDWPGGSRLNCRIYRLADGRFSPTPDPAVLRAALAEQL
jgi:hypothetical protein